MTLREAYKEIMDHIAVTDEMRERILHNLRGGTSSPSVSRPRRPFVPMLAAAACLALLLAGTAALPRLSQLMQGDSSSGVQTGILDRREAASIQELSQLVGFPVEEVEEVPFSVTEIRYTAYGGTMAEVQYEGEEQSLTFRKTAEGGDPSGDYTAYPDTLVLELPWGTVTLKGEEGAYRLALWQEASYGCSLQSAAAYPAEEWTALLESMG